MNMNEYRTDYFILLVDFREPLFSFQYIYYRNSFCYSYTGCDKKVLPFEKESNSSLSFHCLKIFKRYKTNSKISKVIMFMS